MPRETDSRHEKMNAGSATKQGTTYRPPRLVVYGDLSRLTTGKPGTMADGPTTKA